MVFFVNKGMLRSATNSSLSFHHVLPFAFPETRCTQHCQNADIGTKNIVHNLSSEGNRLSTGDCFHFALTDASSTPIRRVSFPYSRARSSDASLSVNLNRCDLNESFDRDLLALKNLFEGQKSTDILLDHSRKFSKTQASLNSLNPVEEVSSFTEIKAQGFENSPYMLVLGTGCAAPSALRGSSGYAIFLPVTGRKHTLTTLLDCGEGCLSALLQHHPLSLSLNDSFRSLRLIWISHAHLDHYGGLPAIVFACFQARRYQIADSDVDSSVVIMAPAKCLQFLNSALGTTNGRIILPNGNSLRIFHSLAHQDYDSCAPPNLQKQILRKIAYISLLKSVPVEHCPGSYALILRLSWSHSREENETTLCSCDNTDVNSKKEFTLAYSGDCRPSRGLVREVAKIIKCDLLIHEATFDNSRMDDALKKRHCTTFEALEIAHQMKAAACLLTHFSQRYSYSSNIMIEKEPRLSSSVNENSDYVNHPLSFCSAVDGLYFPLVDQFFNESFPRLESVLSTIQIRF